MKNQLLSFLGPLLVTACAGYPSTRPTAAPPSSNTTTSAVTDTRPASTTPVATNTPQAAQAAPAPAPTERPAPSTKFALPGPSPTPDNSAASPGAATVPTDASSVTDRKITQDVRRALMDDAKLSANAKNVKITTNNGKVTLRGPVKSEAERTAVEAAAKKIAGAGQVENLLVVSE